MRLLRVSSPLVDALEEAVAALEGGSRKDQGSGQPYRLAAWTAAAKIAAMEASDSKTWETIFTVVTGLATVIIAVFACLTWRVYRNIQHLTAVTNWILEQTNAISAQMVGEARLTREAELRPVILLSPKISGKDGPATEVKWRATNQGSGPAFDITAAGGPGKVEPERKILLATLEPGAERKLCEQTLSAEGQALRSLRLFRIRYRDVFGNWFETQWLNGANHVAPVEDETEETTPVARPRPSGRRPRRLTLGKSKWRPWKRR